MNKVDFIYSQGAVDYEFALDYMAKRVENIIKGIDNQAIWLLEHPSIYTAGRSANDDDILEKIDVPYYYTDRGGKFTYHGPGQRIIYVMLDLNKIFFGKPDIKLFIKKLGNWVISVLKEQQIMAKMDDENIGIWIEDGGGIEAIAGINKSKRKIASIGIKLKKWTSYHGIAININPDMSYFNHIVPCGILDHKMTSLELEKRTKLDYGKLDKTIREKFLKEFNFIGGQEYEV
jgi:lipoyl(octanoyl) transferase